MRYVEKEIQKLLIKELKKAKQSPSKKASKNLIDHSKELVRKHYQGKFENKVTPLFS